LENRYAIIKLNPRYWRITKFFTPYMAFLFRRFVALIYNADCEKWFTPGVKRKQKEAKYLIPFHLSLKMASQKI
jgi:hypothetical protein